MAADPATGRDRFLENRRALPRAGAVFTSVANWSTSGLKDIDWRGEKYLWSKSREFLRFIAAPKRSGETFELATDIKDETTRAKFRAQRLALPRAAWTSASIIVFTAITSGVRKASSPSPKINMSGCKTGWFSDRSACYLAAGRPVITQQTGFTDIYGGTAGCSPSSR